MSSKSPYGKHIVDYLHQFGSMTLSSLLDYIANTSDLRKSELRSRVLETLERMEDMGVLKRMEGQYAVPSLNEELCFEPTYSNDANVVYSLIGSYHKKKSKSKI
ncbi:uncharacterized protein LOC119685722 [Teleopsis dalmanni]|uniref:uncharacterized protein LOC119685721 n=1 Tax=Teleopsis dalmanni TaxID=139649 RepID=UPI0018CEB1DC|nr:uncharacterized protein LOC119685721 [Teleopsis dalmanni]XP_037956010.1 uncharacterized protein LOC119685721 [Teleopsis dalmanni]XP_037956011.1 uncharacterized protein LOC119685721 [Teleopsis dalmanni]XP_037956012.1 uncharacterized protein LOC119685722 [Teleopsis dalmanni]XP_037956013.1 uncharacterized protein LOC119685722 [Teleopsis dalmanni]